MDEYDIYEFILENHGLSKKYNSNKNRVLISGNPRGGTTWLGEIINKTEKSSLIWEPFRPYRLYEMNLHDFSKKLGWFPYLPDNSEWQEADEFIKKSFTLEKINFKSLLKFNPYLKILFKTDYLIFKSVTSNTLLPYINSNVDIKAIYLLRHPCATVSSQLKHPAFTENSGKELNLLKESKFNFIHKQYGSIYSNLETLHEKLAAIWCISNVIPLTTKFHNPNLIRIIFYEDLLENTELIVNQLFHYLEKECNSDLHKHLRKMSSTTLHNPNRTSDNQIALWQKDLSPNEIEQILSVVRKFGITIYDGGIRPKKNELNVDIKKLIIE